MQHTAYKLSALSGCPASSYASTKMLCCSRRNGDGDLRLYHSHIQQMIHRLSSELWVLTKALKIRAFSWLKEKWKTKRFKAWERLDVPLLILRWRGSVMRNAGGLESRDQLMTSKEIQTSVLWPQGTEFPDNLNDLRSKFIPKGSGKESTSICIFISAMWAKDQLSHTMPRLLIYITVV